jgi:hypothetical protein
MRAVFACAVVLLVAVSPAWGQFTRMSDSRSIRAYGDLGSERRTSEALLPFDAMLTVGTSPVSIGSAWQSSRVSATEIFISGGTGDVLWESTNENAGAESAANLTFGVDAPTQVRIRHELAIDSTSFQSWSGAAFLTIAGANPILGISASTQSNEGMRFSPAGAFEIGADGYARTTYDEIILLPAAPGGYELRVVASSSCPGPGATDTCVGKPISFTTHLVVIPEPATWLAVLLMSIALWCYCRLPS